MTGTFLIHNHSVFTLFNSGALYSFISASVVKKLGLKATSEVSLPVTLPTGEVVNCDTKFEGGEIEIVGSKLPSDFIQFELGTLDVILGMDWLKKYKASIDCENQKVRFWSNKGESLVYRRTPKL